MDAHASPSLIKRLRARLHPLRAVYVATVGQQWQDAKIKFCDWRQATAPRSSAAKRLAVRNAGEQHRLRILVETGTFLGDMVAANLRNFDRLYSIELAPHLAQKAQRRFRGQKRVTILEGNSVNRLPEVLSAIAEPALFWLDGHFSGSFTAKADSNTPVRHELAAIFAHPHPHVVLIDDARLFDGTNDYPTIDELRAQIATQGRNYGLSIADDIIYLVPDMSS